jgi:hypothetical protein
VSLDTEPAGLEVLAARFRAFSRECHGSSPLNGHLSAELAEDRDLLERLRPHLAPRFNPNLVFVAVQYLLLDGVAADLATFYPSLTRPPQPPTGAYAAFRRYVDRRFEAVASILSRRITQTNEVGRAALVVPALGFLDPTGRQPLALLEAGASAGLLLLLDRYRYDYGAAGALGDPASPVVIRCVVQGAQPPSLPAVLPVPVWRVGLDVQPVDPRNPDGRRWLLACVWPEHVRRRELLQAALDVAAASPPRVVAGNAADRVVDLAAEAPSRARLIVLSSFMLPYLSAEERVRLAGQVEAAARRRDVDWLVLQGAMGGTEQVLPELSDTARAVVAAHPGEAAVCLVSYRSGRQRATLLGLGHPHGHHLRWLTNT